MNAILQEWNQTAAEGAAGPAALSRSTPAPAALDSEFARKARTEDRAPFTALMNQHKHWLYRYVLRYVHDADDASDIVQDSFVAAWSARAGYDPAWPFAIWLRRIALNKCRDFGRRQKIQHALISFFGLMPETLDVADPAPSPDRACGMQDAMQRLNTAITSLPAALRDPLILTSLEGLSHKEAATVLGLTPKAVEVRVYRAKKLLAERLDPTDADELASPQT